MLLKFITRSLRPLGLFLIFLVAFIGIFTSLIVREADELSTLGSLLDYTVSFENRFYDFRMKKQIDPAVKSKEIVLVRIDDYSLQKIGVFPIPRTNYARMIDKLGDFGAKVIAMDILFPEEAPVLKDVSPDEVLVSSIRNFQSNGGRVFIGYALNGAVPLAEAPVEMLDDALLTKNAPNSDFRPSTIDAYNFPIKSLTESGVGFGYLTAELDSDGIFRHYKLAANVDTIYYGSLGYNAFEAYTGKKQTIEISAGNQGELRINGRSLELNSKGEAKVRYLGGTENFDSVALHDLLEADPSDQKMRSLFEGKIVFLGSTAIGAHDLRPTAIDPKLPGVYVHMNLAHMLLHQYFLKPMEKSVYYSMALLLVGILLFLLVQKFGNPFLDAAFIAVYLGAAYYADQLYFLPEGYELKLFYCYFCFIASYSWNTFYKFYESNKEKKQIRGTFARYVAPTIVDEMLKDPEKLQVGGTKMDITCLFSDVRDFTKISENLTALELSHSLNIYMGAMTDIVFDTKGTLDKYIGDAIVALWGAPLPIGNHAQYAVEAAIKMMDVLPEINARFEALGRPKFNVGVGLNTGECSVGNMGSSRIFSYTALGDNMNLGARLEGLCKYYGTQILISEMTLERLDLSQIKVRPIDKVIVKGKTTPVAIYEVLHPHHWMTANSQAFESYLRGHGEFQKQDFTEAKASFEEVCAMNPDDKAALRLLNLCEKYLGNPGAVDQYFDVTTMTEK